MKHTTSHTYSNTHSTVFSFLHLRSADLTSVSMISFFDKIELYFSFIDNMSSLSLSHLCILKSESNQNSQTFFKKFQSLLGDQNVTRVSRISMELS